MIELNDIFAVTICIFPGLVLVALTIFYIWKTEKRKKTLNQLRSEVVFLRHENQRLNALLASSPQGDKDSSSEQVSPDAGMSRMSARESLMMSLLHETVLNNYPNPEFGVDELAVALGISRSSLNRRMRDTLNTTANHYIRDVRIQKAEELLCSSSLQINEICYKVGFQTPSYFIKCFRKKYGKSPNEYANSSRQ